MQGHALWSCSWAKIAARNNHSKENVGFNIAFTGSYMDKKKCLKNMYVCGNVRM